MVGKAKWKPGELPLPGTMVNPEQDHIPGGITQISTTVKAWKDEGGGPHHTPINPPTGLCRRQVVLENDGRAL